MTNQCRPFSLKFRVDSADTSKRDTKVLAEIVTRRSSTTRPSMALPRLPNYEVHKSLGGGMLTSVYAARRLSDDQHCVVKVLRSDWKHEPAAIKLLQREARACLTVQHRHLVRLLDAHVTAEPYFIVMEFISGEGLKPLLRRKYRLDLNDALWTARQVAEALQKMHKAGFIHGDIKPDNIRIKEDGTAVLLDLGFAHRLGENSALHEQGFILGTLDYLAPELCSPEPEGGYSTDIFSLGVTLFEMITGRLPYPSGSVRQTLSRHEADPPLDIRHCDGNLPSQLVRLIGRMLHRKPQKRPSASTVVQKLITQEISALNLPRAA